MSLFGYPRYVLSGYYDDGSHHVSYFYKFDDWYSYAYFQFYPRDYVDLKYGQIENLYTGEIWDILLDHKRYEYIVKLVE